MDDEHSPIMANETGNATPIPNTLDAWVKQLDAVRLPIPQDSHERVCKAINDNRRSLRDIAELMQDSPALALSLIRDANHHTHGSLSEPAESLEVAINRLGWPAHKNCLNACPRCRGKKSRRLFARFN